MAKQLRRGRLTVEVFFETEEPNLTRTRLYAIAMAKGMYAHGKNGNFAVRVFENGRQVGVDINGDPSDAMLDDMDAVLEANPEEVATG